MGASNHYKENLAIIFSLMYFIIIIWLQCIIHLVYTVHDKYYYTSLKQGLH